MLKPEAAPVQTALRWHAVYSNSQSTLPAEPTKQPLSGRSGPSEGACDALARSRLWRRLLLPCSISRHFHRRICYANRAVSALRLSSEVSLSPSRRSLLGPRRTHTSPHATIATILKSCAIRRPRIIRRWSDQACAARYAARRRRRRPVPTSPKSVLDYVLVLRLHCDPVLPPQRRQDRRTSPATAF